MILLCVWEKENPNIYEKALMATMIYHQYIASKKIVDFNQTISVPMDLKLKGEEKVVSKESYFVCVSACVHAYLCW